MLNKLGEPHLHLAGLKLWVHGYQYRDVDDHWDGNWLNTTGMCAANGATALIRGAFLRTNEIHDWQLAVDKLSVDLKGEAILDCMEPELAVILIAQTPGVVEMEVRITPDELTEESRFTFAIDQSELLSLSAQCAQLLTAFPIRGD